MANREMPNHDLPLGAPGGYVDAAHARWMVAELMRRGFSAAEVARGCEVSEQTVRRLRWGDHDGTPVREVRRGVDEAVTAGYRRMRHEVPARIDATLCAAAMRRLHAMGWSWEEMARRAGCGPTAVRDVALGRAARARTDVALAVAEMAREASREVVGDAN